jgi:hypothetical protein
MPIALKNPQKPLFLSQNHYFKPLATIFSKIKLQLSDLNP